MTGKQEKLFALIDTYTEREVIVAFSGGVDSALLLHLVCAVAHPKKHQVHAVTFKTSLHPAREITLAQNLARETGAIHHLVEVNDLLAAGIGNNPQNRCYLCKKYLFGKLRDMAEPMRIPVIMDGSNDDDMHAHRPGIQALGELKIASPLAEAGLTKQEVRRMAGEYGLSVARKPSTPCLATRFPYGTALSTEILERVARGEEHLHSLGFYNVRLRVHGEICRIEVDREELGRICREREKIIAHLKDLGYRYITIDLEGFRSGSMDSPGHPLPGEKSQF